MVLAACSPETSGTASPVSTPSSSRVSGTGQEVPGPGVPSVANPIDTTRSASEPCSALTDSQVEELFGRPVTPKPDLKAPAGPTCSWDPADGSGASVNVIFATVDDLGLTGVYRARGTNYKLFEPLQPIEGYPAVIYGTSDYRSEGMCSLAIGTSDHSTIDLTVTQSRANVGKTDPCQSAKTVASKVVVSLKERK
ncbi:DUF3558 domain-containing protein [Amycolatopsis sp. NPDC101161]|uniref:DUF3558 domain-containing protein n=1 Tax=Amycolatopsis sp. NPDC101161 TaxID=3363940 RepID=UPI0037F26B2D